jgi:hypothetical protein
MTLDIAVDSCSTIGYATVVFSIDLDEKFECVVFSAFFKIKAIVGLVPHQPNLTRISEV